MKTRKEIQKDIRFQDNLKNVVYNSLLDHLYGIDTSLPGISEITGCTGKTISEVTITGTSFHVGRLFTNIWGEPVTIEERAVLEQINEYNQSNHIRIRYHFNIWGRLIMKKVPLIDWLKSYFKKN